MLSLTDDLLMYMGVLSMCRIAMTCHSMYDRTADCRRVVHRVQEFIRFIIPPQTHHLFCGHELACCSTRPMMVFHTFAYTYNVLVTGSWQPSTKQWRGQLVRRPLVESLRLPNGILLHEKLRFQDLCPMFKESLSDVLLDVPLTLSYEEFECGAICPGPRGGAQFRTVEHVVITAPALFGSLTMRGNLITSGLSGARGIHSLSPPFNSFFEELTQINWTSIVYSFAK